MILLNHKIITYSSNFIKKMFTSPFDIEATCLKSVYNIIQDYLHIFSPSCFRIQV